MKPLFASGSCCLLFFAGCCWLLLFALFCCCPKEPTTSTTNNTNKHQTHKQQQIPNNNRQGSFWLFVDSIFLRFFGSLFETREIHKTIFSKQGTNIKKMTTPAEQKFMFMVKFRRSKNKQKRSFNT